MRTRDDSFETDPVARLIEDCLDLPAGERDRGFLRLLEEHPEHRERITTQWRLLREAGLLEEPGETDHDGFPERLGKYVLERRLGAGGMGVVYQARESDLGRRVALKVIRPEFAYFEGSRRRFEREIDAIARLQHENIVPLYAAGEQDGVSFLAMQYLEGASLADLVERLPRTPAPALPRAAVEKALRSFVDEGVAVDLARLGETWFAMALEIARQVAEALEHAHGRGIVHRDVKPQNVFLGPRGTVTLLDFGLARAADGSRMTQSGAALGSLAYMSPEQVAGDWEALGAASDVYGLGATLYELLCGAPPHRERDGQALRAAILNGDVVPARRRVPELSRDVDAVLGTALARDPQRRYGSAGAFVRDLTRLLEGRPVDARAPSLAQRMAHWCRRHPTASVAAALVLFVGPLVVGAQAWIANARLQRQVEETNAREGIIRDEVLGMLHQTWRDLANVPGADALRKDLTERARRALEALERLGPTKDLHRELATVHAFLGEVAAEHAAFDAAALAEAEAHYDRAWEAWRAFLAEHPRDRAVRLDVHLTALRIARLERLRAAEARAQAREDAALAGLETLAAERAEDRATRLALVAALLDRAADPDEDPARAQALAARAETACRALLERDPADRLARHDLVLSLLRRGSFGVLEADLERLREAEALAWRLTLDHPASRDHRRLLADALWWRARAHARRGEAAAARAALDDAERELEVLLAEDPGDLAVRGMLARSIVEGRAEGIAACDPAGSTEERARRTRQRLERLFALAPPFALARAAEEWFAQAILPAWVDVLAEAEAEAPASVPGWMQAWLDGLLRAAPDGERDPGAFAAWERVVEAHVAACLDALDACRPRLTGADAVAAELTCAFPRLAPVWSFVHRVRERSPRLARLALDRSIPCMERGLRAFPQHPSVHKNHALFREVRGRLGRDEASREDLRAALRSAEFLLAQLAGAEPSVLRQAHATRWQCLTALAERTAAWPPFAGWVLDAAQARAFETYETLWHERGDARSASSVAWALDTAWPPSAEHLARALELAERARERAGTDPERHDVFHTSAAICERRGDHDAAVRWQREALDRLSRSTDAARVDLQESYRAALDRLRRPR